MTPGQAAELIDVLEQISGLLFVQTWAVVSGVLVYAYCVFWRK
jgi:hypothetical protein